ncbi:MAG: hypothetical protein CL993_02550 [Euryarchaeota archaeon]|nr:hypothetical protein [Euryarchaeota archaeon]
MVGIRPRSRWSNRDDSSYKVDRDDSELPSKLFSSKKSNTQNNKFKTNYSTTKKFAGSKLFLISQLSGVTFLVIFFSGLNNTSPDFTYISFFGIKWKSGSDVLILLISVGMIYILTFFRILISGRVPKKRKKKTRNRFIILILITLYIYRNYN